MKFLLEEEETARLHFRKINNSDFDSWLEFFKHPSSLEHWVGQFDKPEIECKKWFDRQAKRYENNEGGMNALIEKQTGILIGYCGLLVQTVDQQKELEVAYSLLPYFRNKGYATEASKKCIDFAFQNNFADSLISIISLTNAPSANVALKNRMKIEKQTVYKENQVNIFRVYKSDWTSSNK
jgi:ribosomal-protein-alanine N-acetyltransferase